MARKYAEAAEELEKIYKKNPNNKNVIKKLIVCYTQIGKVNLAFELFYLLVNEDIELIIKTDPIKDDCPCFELVERDIYTEKYNLESTDIMIVKGIIWLYCDLEKSLKIFEEINHIIKNNKIKGIIKKMKEYKNSLVINSTK